jgi:hypothetical protein
MSASQVHRIVTDLVSRMAALLGTSAMSDRRRTSNVDGTLVPTTRDHRVAAKSKTYRWACNLQVLVRHGDRCVVAIAGGGPGQPQRPRSLPKFRDGTPVPVAWPRGGRRRLSRHR